MNLLDWLERRLNKTLEIGIEDARARPIEMFIETAVVGLGTLCISLWLFVRVFSAGEPEMTR